MSDGFRFLVVDSLAGVQTFTRHLLEEFGFAPEDICCASDTEAALALGQAFKPDFVLSDWFVQSGLSGIGLFQRLRETCPDCRLALLSFNVSADHEAEAHAAGARFLLRKPFTAKELADTLRRSLESLAMQQPALRLRLNPLLNKGRPAGFVRPQPVLPPMQLLKSGDKVRYGGCIETVQCVVVGRGELMVQLRNRSALVPVSKLQPV